MTNHVDMPKSHGQDWVGASGAAAYVGVTLRTLYRMIDHDGLPAYRVGRVIRLRWDAIEAFVESRRIAPGSLCHLYPHEVPDYPRQRRRRRPPGSAPPPPR